MTEIVETTQTTQDADLKGPPGTFIDVPTPAPDAPKDAPVENEPAPKDNPTPAEAPAEAPEEEDFGSVNDDSGDAAITIMKESGMSREDALSIFGEAAESGDLSKIDTAKLYEKLGQQKGQAVLALVKDYYNRVLAPQHEIVNAVYTHVGGKDQFNKLATWARTRAETDPVMAQQLVEINSMIQLGKNPALLATESLVKLYNADPRNKSITIKMVQGTHKAPVDYSAPLERGEYLDQLKKAYEKNDHALIQRLNAQRLKSLTQS